MVQWKDTAAVAAAAAAAAAAGTHRRSWGIGDPTVFGERTPHVLRQFL